MNVARQAIAAEIENQALQDCSDAPVFQPLQSTSPETLDAEEVYFSSSPSDAHTQPLPKILSLKNTNIPIPSLSKSLSSSYVPDT